MYAKTFIFYATKESKHIQYVNLFALLLDEPNSRVTFSYESSFGFHDI